MFQIGQIISPTYDIKKHFKIIEVIDYKHYVIVSIDDDMELKMVVNTSQNNWNLSNIYTRKDKINKILGKIRNN